MIVGGWIFRRRKIWKFVCQLVWLVDQSRQALRANKNFPALKFKGDEWSILFGCSAVQTGGKGHGFSLMNFVHDRNVELWFRGHMAAGP